MSHHMSPTEPIRNRNGDVVYTSFEERPQAAFQLDLVHKILLIISLVVAVLGPLVFVTQIFGTTDLLPVRYGVGGDVLREGSVWEAAAALTFLGLATIAVAVLTRYPRIYNFPFMLTEHTVQRQYKNAVQMMVWIAFSMALIMIVLIGSWLGFLTMAWIWVALGIMVAAAIFFIRRMTQLR